MKISFSVEPHGFTAVAHPHSSSGETRRSPACPPPSGSARQVGLAKAGKSQDMQDYTEFIPFFRVIYGFLPDNH